MSKPDPSRPNRNQLRDEMAIKVLPLALNYVREKIVGFEWLDPADDDKASVDIQMVGEYAYLLADAMMEARSKGKA